MDIAVQDQIFAAIKALPPGIDIGKNRFGILTDAEVRRFFPEPTMCVCPLGAVLLAHPDISADERLMIIQSDWPFLDYAFCSILMERLQVNRTEIYAILHDFDSRPPLAGR